MDLLEDLKSYKIAYTEYLKLCNRIELDIKKYSKVGLIADMLNISSTSLTTRFKNPSKWDLEEVEKVVSFLESIKKGLK